MRILHISDTHLGYGTVGRSHLPERERDFYDALDEVIQIAIEEEVNAVLHGGDMFHRSTPEPQTYVRAIEALKKLREKGIRFFVVAGNHDTPRTYRHSPLRVLEKIGLLEILSLKEPGKAVIRSPQGFDVEIYGYSKEASEKFFREKIPVDKGNKDVIRIALVHALTCEPMEIYLGWSPEVCEEREAPRLASSINKDVFSYIALGDLHIYWEGRVGNAVAVYPGSTEALDRSEAFDKDGKFIERRAYIVDIDRDGVYPRYRRLGNTRPWILVSGADYRDVIRKLQTLNLGSYRKSPILTIKLGREPSPSENEVLNRELERLVSEKKILALDDVLKPGGDERLMLYDVKSPGEAEEIPTLESVLKEVFMDEKISKVIFEYIENRLSNDDLLKMLREDRDLLEKLNQILARMLSRGSR
ncbi:MAG: DNA repair exonuclease [Sulfolobales archaeon]